MCSNASGVKVGDRNYFFSLSCVDIARERMTELLHAGLFYQL